MAESQGCTLYLLRHAKAQKAVPGEDDLSRPLIRRGREGAERMATWLADNKVRPDTILCSPSARTRETLAIVQPALGAAQIVFDAGLYGASAHTLLATIRRLPRESRSALVIGHNPGIGELAIALAGHGSPRIVAKLREKYPTGALAVIAAPVDEWKDFDAASRIEDFIRPADLE